VQRRTGASERGHAIEEENNPRKLARAKGRAREKEYRNFDKWKKPRAAENLNKTRRKSLTRALLKRRCTGSEVRGVNFAKAVHGIRNRSLFWKTQRTGPEVRAGDFWKTRRTGPEVREAGDSCKGGARDQKCEQSKFMWTTGVFCLRADAK